MAEPERNGRNPGQEAEPVTASPFVTVPELATLLRVSVWQVYDWTRQVGPDAIPSYKGGKRILFDEHEALAWFRETQARRARVRLRSSNSPARRRAPGTHSGGRRARKPSRARVSASAPTAGAAPVPAGDAIDGLGDGRR